MRKTGLKLFSYTSLLALTILLFWPYIHVNAQSGSLYKSAYNQTQGVNAEAVAARPGDTITYTLTYRNSTGITQTVQIEDDITDVLYLAQISNLGGSSWQGSRLTWPSVSVSAGQQIDRTFQVQVKSIPAGTRDLVMSNYYGNGVDISVVPSGGTAVPYKGAVAGTYQAPATGTNENVSLGLAGALTAIVFIYKHRQKTPGIAKA